MVQKKTILIVDDHPLFREGLKTIIARNTAYEVVGESGNGRDALQITKKIKPDLALVDMSLPDQNGIELTRDLRKSSPNTKVMIVSMHSKIDYIVHAFRAGATGYLVKESAAEKLLEGINLVLNGEYFMDTALSRKVIQKLAGLQENKARMANGAYDSLTPREQEVMALVAEGFSSDEIGERLFISPKTVENHRSNIMRKLNLHSTIEIMRYAVKIGLIDVDFWKE